MEPAWWVALEPPWRACLEQAWDSFANGSLPVGAAVVDPEGEIVATGRSRQREPTAAAPYIAGTNIAHAEVNALLQLPRGDYSAHTLYSTLQPCLLCTGAICHSHIGAVRYAAADPLFAGIERLPELIAHVARRWPRWEGPFRAPFASWSQLLTFIFAVHNDPAKVTAPARHSAALGDMIAAVTALASPIDTITGQSLAEALVDERLTALLDQFSALASTP